MAKLEVEKIVIEGTKATVIFRFDRTLTIEESLSIQTGHHENAWLKHPAHQLLQRAFAQLAFRIEEYGKAIERHEDCQPKDLQVLIEELREKQRNKGYENQRSREIP